MVSSKRGTIQAPTTYPHHITWLVVTGTMEFYDFPYIGNIIIPTDEVIFFRGVGQPPSSVWLNSSLIMLVASPKLLVSVSSPFFFVRVPKLCRNMASFKIHPMISSRLTQKCTKNVSPCHISCDEHHHK